MKERFSQELSELGKKLRNTKSSLVVGVKGVGSTLAHKTRGVKASLRKLARGVKRGF